MMRKKLKIEERKGVIWYNGNLEWDFSRDGRISLGQEKRRKQRWVVM